jgi:hypothetical protein
MFLYHLGQPMPFTLPVPSALNIAYVLVLITAVGCAAPAAAVVAATTCGDVCTFSLASILLQPGTYLLHLFAQTSPTNTDTTLATRLPFPELSVQVLPTPST